MVREVNKEFKAILRRQGRIFVITIPKDVVDELNLKEGAVLKLEIKEVME